MTCKCVSRQGIPKKLYDSRRAAISAAIDQGWKQFRSYQCPEIKKKYHLTTKGKK